MRVPNRHRLREQTDVEMTPMIDVVFLLLIFFVWTASFQLVEHDLPTNVIALQGAGDQQKIDLDQPPPEQVIIKIRDADGQIDWTINGQVYDSFATLRRKSAALASLGLEIPVILDVEGEVPLGRVIDVYDVCLVVGFPTIQFAARLDAF